MKKVGIITITDGANYGNRLQNYAMQETIKQLGFYVETIQRKTNRDKKIYRIKKYIKYLIKNILRMPCDKEYRKRKRKFCDFNGKYIKFAPYILHDNRAPKKFAEKYDYFIVGSDQVWNARIDIVRQDIKNYLAFFAGPKQKIAYAASFGTEDIAIGFETIYKKELSSFRAISVRENAGVSIVEKCCGRKDVKVVLDPTMLLSAKQWKKIEKKPCYMENQKYIVTYFLGGRNQKINSYIQMVEKKYQATVVNLDIEFLKDNEIENNQMYETSPEEFIWLIHHAQCVLTDSFHATVFSILFHKPFCTLERKEAEKGNKMGSRIETLVNKFELFNFYVKENRIVMPEEYDGEKIEQIIQKERENSLEFLQKNLL